ncbi:hypothetical protein [Thalassorhabdomicrobium marinisediminis]|nr:hypothetical protein [Thalassorhabdomicrobium marinisediminis]
MKPARRAKRSLKTEFNRMLVRIRARVPPGMRVVVGFILVCFGILGFLPILGFWMIPLGIAVMMLDIGPAWRRFKNRR